MSVGLDRLREMASSGDEYGMARCHLEEAIALIDGLLIASKSHGSLLDDFAAAAMTSLIESVSDSDERIAKCSYDLASAMLSERKKRMAGGEEKG